MEPLKTLRNLSAGKILLIIALILFAINIPRCFYGDYWFDEASSIIIARRSLIDVILNSADSDMHPPLHYVLLWCSIRLFGENPFFFHMISLAAYGGILLCCATAVKRHFGFMAAIVTMLLATFLDTAFFYDTEIRMYEIALMCVLISYVSLYAILKYNEKKDWYLLVISTLVGAYSYYFCILIIGILYLVLLATIIIRKKELLKRFVIACAAGIICYLPCLTMLLRTYKDGTTTFWPKRIVGIDEVLNYVFQSGIKEFLTITFVILSVFTLWKLYRNSNGNASKFSIKNYFTGMDEKTIWIWAGLLSIIGTTAIIMAVSLLIKPVATARHFFPLSIIGWLLMGIYLSEIDYGKMKRYAPTVIVASIMIAGAVNFCNMADAEKKSWDSAKNILEKTSEIGKNGKDDHVISDIMSFTEKDIYIIPCYYPDCSYEFKRDINKIQIDYSLHNWFFLREKIPDNIEEELKKHGCEADLIVEGTFAKKNYVYVYKIIKDESGNTEFSDTIQNNVDTYGFDWGRKWIA